MANDVLSAVDALEEETASNIFLDQMCTPMFGVGLLLLVSTISICGLNGFLIGVPLFLLYVLMEFRYTRAHSIASDTSYAVQYVSPTSATKKNEALLITHNSVLSLNNAGTRRNSIALALRNRLSLKGGERDADLLYSALISTDAKPSPLAVVRKTLYGGLTSAVLRGAPNFIILACTFLCNLYAQDMVCSIYGVSQIVPPEVLKIVIGAITSGIGVLALLRPRAFARRLQYISVGACAIGSLLWVCHREPVSVRSITTVLLTENYMCVLWQAGACLMHVFYTSERRRNSLQSYEGQSMHSNNILFWLARFILLCFYMALVAISYYIPERSLEGLVFGYATTSIVRNIARSAFLIGLLSASGLSTRILSAEMRSQDFKMASKACRYVVPLLASSFSAVLAILCNTLVDPATRGVIVCFTLLISGGVLLPFIALVLPTVRYIQRNCKNWVIVAKGLVLLALTFIFISGSVLALDFRHVAIPTNRTESLHFNTTNTSSTIWPNTTWSPPQTTDAPLNSTDTWQDISTTEYPEITTTMEVPTPKNPWVMHPQLKACSYKLPEQALDNCQVLLDSRSFHLITFKLPRLGSVAILDNIEFREHSMWWRASLPQNEKPIGFFDSRERIPLVALNSKKRLSQVLREDYYLRIENGSAFEKYTKSFDDYPFLYTRRCALAIAPDKAVIYAFDQSTQVIAYSLSTIRNRPLRLSTSSHLKTDADIDVIFNGREVCPQLQDGLSTVCMRTLISKNAMLVNYKFRGGPWLEFKMKQVASEFDTPVWKVEEPRDEVLLSIWKSLNRNSVINESLPLATVQNVYDKIALSILYKHKDDSLARCRVSSIRSKEIEIQVVDYQGVWTNVVVYKLGNGFQPYAIVKNASTTDQ